MDFGPRESSFFYFPDVVHGSNSADMTDRKRALGDSAWPREK